MAIQDYWYGVIIQETVKSLEELSKDKELKVVNREELLDADYDDSNIYIFKDNNEPLRIDVKETGDCHSILEFKVKVTRDIANVSFTNVITGENGQNQFRLDRGWFPASEELLVKDTVDYITKSSLKFIKSIMKKNELNETL